MLTGPQLEWLAAYEREQRKEETMRPVHTVRLTEADLLLARQWEREVLASDTMEKPSHTGLERPDRYFVGYLGEIAVAQTLRDYGVAYVYRVHLMGKSAPSEFLAGSTEGRVEVEVKTANGAWRDLMLVAQVHRRRDPKEAVYVGARIERLAAPHFADVSIQGWARGPEVDGWPVKEFTKRLPSHNAPYDTLRPFSELVGLLTPVVVVERREPEEQQVPQEFGDA